MPSYQETLFAGIADAIREKEKSSGKIRALDFEPRIRALKIGDSDEISTITFQNNAPEFAVRNCYLAYSINKRPMNENIFPNNAKSAKISVNNGTIGVFIVGSNVLENVILRTSDGEEYLKQSNFIKVIFSADDAFLFECLTLTQAIPAGKTVTVSIERK